MESRLRQLRALRTRAAPLLLLLLGAVAGDLEGGDRSRDCVLSRVRPCIDTLTQLASDNAITRAANETQLDDACLVARNAVDCVTSYITNCFNKTNRELYLKTASTANSLINAICLPGDFRNRFLEHVPCLRLVTIDYNHCGYLYKKTAYHIERGDNKQASPDVCCSYNELINCSRTVSKNLCDKEGADFVEEYLERSGDVPIRGNCSRYQAAPELCPGSAAGRRADGPLPAGLALLVLVSRLLGRCQ